jgi:hypothetical protein
MLNFLRDMTRRVEASQRTAIERANQQARKSLSPQKVASAVRAERSPALQQAKQSRIMKPIDHAAALQELGRGSGDEGPHGGASSSLPQTPAQRPWEDAHTPQTSGSRASPRGLANTGYLSTPYLSGNDSHGHTEYASHGKHEGSMAQYDVFKHSQQAPRSSGTSDAGARQWGVVPGTLSSTAAGREGK